MRYYQSMSAWWLLFFHAHRKVGSQRPMGEACDRTAHTTTFYIVHECLRYVRDPDPGVTEVKMNLKLHTTYM